MAEHTPATKGNGKTIQWIRDHASYPHRDWCLIWPFSKTRGYGAFGYLGKKYYAHRFMCELANGLAPSPIHEAAHSCGDEGCVNPHHVSWKTPGENGLDNKKHGTHVRSRYGNAGKITKDQAETIRGLKGVKRLWEIADEYGISESAVSNIWVGKTHYRDRKLINWTAEEDQIIREGTSRGLGFSQLAVLLPGRTPHGVGARAYRLGLKSGQGPGGSTFRSSQVSPAQLGGGK